MTVRTCEINGQPGYQWRPAQGPAGECHVFDPADDEAKNAALAAAARDGHNAVTDEVLPPSP